MGYYLLYSISLFALVLGTGKLSFTSLQDMQRGADS